MASWTISPGLMVSFRLLEMLFMGAQWPEEGRETNQSDVRRGEKELESYREGQRGKCDEQGRKEEEEIQKVGLFRAGAVECKEIK